MGQLTLDEKHFIFVQFSPPEEFNSRELYFLFLLIHPNNLSSSAFSFLSNYIQTIV